MYRRSENSESSASSRTAITGQSGKLSREGIISEANSQGKDSSKDAKNFRTLEFTPQTRAQDSRTVRSDANNGRTKNQRGKAPYNNQSLYGNYAAASAKKENIKNAPQIRPQAMQNNAASGNPAQNTARINPVPRNTAGTSCQKRSVPNPESRKRKPSKPTYLLCKALLCIYETFMKHKGRIAFASCVLIGSIILVTGVYAISELSTSGTSGSADFSMVDFNYSGENLLKTEDIPTSFTSTLISSEKAEKSSESKSAEDKKNDTAENNTETENTESDKIVLGAKSGESALLSNGDSGERFTVELRFYNKDSIVCTTPETTVRNLLDASGYVLGDSERLNADPDEIIDSDRVINIDTVEYKSVSETVWIPFETETIEVQTIPRGTTQTITDGQNGTKEVVYSVEYVNGVETSRNVQSEYITQYPVNQVNQYGTGGVIYAYDGSSYSYSYYITVRATYYNLPGTTASGMPTGNNVIATDPSVIPLGTNVYLKNSTFDMGVKVAADTGGGVNGNMVDIWMDESSPNYALFAQHGVWEMTAYILD